MVQAFLVLIFLVLPFGWISSFVSRKMTADLQARVGPAEIGLRGFWQPIADTLKLLNKKESYRYEFRTVFWNFASMAALVSTTLLLPLGQPLIVVDTDFSAIFIVLVSGWVGICNLLVEPKNRNQTKLISGMRVSIQTLTSLVPITVSLLTVLLMTGSLSWRSLVEIQSFYPWGWTAFQSLFGFVAFLIYSVSGLMLFQIRPFDTGLSASSLQGGIAQDLNGFTYSVFSFGRNYALFFWLLTTVVIFFGGWRLPDGIESNLGLSSSLVSISINLFWLFLKIAMLYLVLVLLWAALPRLRYDQVGMMIWRVLAPASIVNLIFAVIWKGLVS